MFYVVCTAKPSDGLLHYSYEYARRLDQGPFQTELLIFPHPDFDKSHYKSALINKYNDVRGVIFDDEVVAHWPSDGSLFMGRSMITLPYRQEGRYTAVQKYRMSELLKKAIVVYSENHPESEYQAALMFFNAQNTLDIGDTEVYNKFNGIHFEKHIHFQYYRPIDDNPICKHLFLGTNREYYVDALRLIDKYEDSKIIVYKNQRGLLDSYEDKHIYVPVENLCGLFEKYVYTKRTFDPAPRIMQECKYYGKEFIYERPEMHDGGSVYLNRPVVEEPDITGIIEAVKKIRMMKVA